MLLVTAVAVVGLTVAAGTAMAGQTGPNNANAKACQKIGWKSLYPTIAPYVFESEQACTSYAAQGGTLSTLNGYHQVCLSLTNNFYSVIPGGFRCSASGNLGSEEANKAARDSAFFALHVACDALGGGRPHGFAVAVESDWFLSLDCLTDG